MEAIPQLSRLQSQFAERRTHFFIRDGSVVLVEVQNLHGNVLHLKPIAHMFNTTNPAKVPKSTVTSS